MQRLCNYRIMHWHINWLRSVCRDRDGISLRSTSCCPLDHGTVKRCNYCKAVIAKLQSSSTVQVALRDTSLRTLFLNRVHFDLLESVDISFLNTYVNGRFVQWRWSESLWQKKLMCSVTVAKSSFFLWYNFLFEQTNHIRTAVHGHPQLPLKCRLPNRISSGAIDRCFCKV